MTAQRVRGKSGARRAPDLRGRWLWPARIGWYALTVLSLTFVIWGLPKRFSELTLFWFTSNPVPQAVVREGLDQIGITPGIFAGYGVALYVVRVAAFYLAGALLFWRNPTERVALLVACFLVSIPAGDTDPPVLHEMLAETPVRAVAGLVVETIGFTLLLWLLLLFPDGYFRPRWTRMVAVPWLLMGVGTLFLPGSPIDLLSWPLLLYVGFVPACVAPAVIAQVWRYRRISDPVERQQTKWFSLGLAIVLVEFAIGNVLTEYERIAWPAASPAQVVLTDMLLHTIHTVAFLAIPLSLSVAVLRHRLWDIDILINRALVYGSLSAMLAGFYLGSVVLLQGLVSAASGQGSDLAIAAATLATAALIQPLRRRLQATIDRRFYRHKYDAARTAAALGAALRNETDLGRIQADLLQVVQETMQPAHVSLWLRSDTAR